MQSMLPNICCQTSEDTFLKSLQESILFYQTIVKVRKGGILIRKSIMREV
jgi:hypothetical protein